MWSDPEGDPTTKAAYKLPFVSKSGGKHAVWKAITAIAGVLQGARGGSSIPEADIPGLKRKIESYYAKARDKYGIDTQVPWASGNAAGPAEFRYAVAPIMGVDVRDSSGTFDNTWTMSGYAAVFNETTTLLDSKFVKLTESVHERAFDNVLREQGLNTSAGVVHFNFGHDMNRAVAATDVNPGMPGSLELRSDSRGLYFLAKVSRDDPDGLAMAVKMRDGVLRQASFAFTIANGGSEYHYVENEDGPDTEHRTITKVGHLYDVCATPQGAYSSTVSGLRSYGAAIGQPAMGGQHRQPGSGGEIAVSRMPELEEGVGGGESSISPELLEEIRAKAVHPIRPILVGVAKETDDGGTDS